MFACFHDHIHVAALLITNGADHKMRNSEKKTAFQYVNDKDKLQLLTDLVSTGMYIPVTYFGPFSIIDPNVNINLSYSFSFVVLEGGDDGSPIMKDLQHRLATIFNPHQSLRKKQVNNNNNSQVFDVSSLGKVGGSSGVAVRAGIASSTINPTQSNLPVKTSPQLHLSEKNKETRNSFSPSSARPPTLSPRPSQHRSRSLLMQVTDKHIFTTIQK